MVLGAVLMIRSCLDERAGGFLMVMCLITDAVQAWDEEVALLWCLSFALLLGGYAGMLQT